MRERERENNAIFRKDHFCLYHMVGVLLLEGKGKRKRKRKRKKEFKQETCLIICFCFYQILEFTIIDQKKMK